MSYKIGKNHERNVRNRVKSVTPSYTILSDTKSMMLNLSGTTYVLKNGGWVKITGVRNGT